MASIDKTYTDSFQEYKSFKDWADSQVVAFFDGHTERVGDWVYELDESDFDGRELPIMNTPTWLDTFLIQNCKHQFVSDRMQGVYDDYIEVLKGVNLSQRPTGQQNRKLRISKTKRTKFPIHNKCYKGKWWLQCYGDLWYNDETRTWAKSDMYPTNTNTASFKTVKAVVRHLRKQYLSSGITFSLSGYYVGEDYLITVL